MPICTRCGKVLKEEEVEKHVCGETLEERVKRLEDIILKQK